MDKNDLISLIKLLLNKSEEKLRSARILYASGQYDDSISRSYYAAFLAAKAILLTLGSEPKTHSGILTMLGLKAIKEGILPLEVGKILNELFEAQQTSDYGYFSYYEDEDCKKYLELSAKVIEIIKQALKDKLKIDL